VPGIIAAFIGTLHWYSRRRAWKRRLLIILWCHGFVASPRLPQYPKTFSLLLFFLLSFLPSAGVRQFVVANLMDSDTTRHEQNICAGRLLLDRLESLAGPRLIVPIFRIDGVEHTPRSALVIS